ncbi:PDZ domain-containing protein [Streptomyces sp. AcE210]|uniref:PDZ domain-containing protein n=1 Tax=Streptomyces sp. AcE210 TaxID=2292703 RepID=UPI000E309F24|nr:PDZ domain-containing protein [Streptomyces sp. AcE210]RFC71678.1 PDZ domain-containing protein [Streptomyces sp. AcE210]
MEQTALRPKSMPGAPRREAAAARGNGSGGRRPHAARRRGKRLVTLLLGLLFGAVLVLSGVGLGTVGAAVIGMSKLAEMQQRAGAAPRPPALVPSRPSTASTSPSPSVRPARAALGVEAVDAPEGAGALLVGVHIPGPGYTAGLVRGDVLIAFGGTRIGSAGALAQAVAAARPGRQVTLTVRHESGARQVLAVTPGVVT